MASEQSFYHRLTAEINEAHIDSDKWGLYAQCTCTLGVHDGAVIRQSSAAFVRCIDLRMYTAAGCALEQTTRLFFSESLVSHQQRHNITDMCLVCDNILNTTSVAPLLLHKHART